MWYLLISSTGFNTLETIVAINKTCVKAAARLDIHLLSTRYQTELTCSKVANAYIESTS